MTRKHLLGVLGDGTCGRRGGIRGERSLEDAHRSRRMTRTTPSLTYWYWAESDAPGANDWLKKRGREVPEGASEGQDHDRHRSRPTR